VSVSIADKSLLSVSTHPCSPTLRVHISVKHKLIRNLQPCSCGLRIPTLMLILASAMCRVPMTRHVLYDASARIAWGSPLLMVITRCAPLTIDPLSFLILLLIQHLFLYAFFLSPCSCPLLFSLSECPSVSFPLRVVFLMFTINYFSPRLDHFYSCVATPSIRWVFTCCCRLLFTLLFPFCLLLHLLHTYIYCVLFVYLSLLFCGYFVVLCFVVVLLL
jgi:hypothetical protein